MIKYTGVHFGLIDDILGARENRFFGDGFRRVNHQIRDIKVGYSDDGNGYAVAKTIVQYPRDWSKKSKSDELRPHLSSIDAVVLSNQLNEFYLTVKYGLNNIQRQRTWLRRLVMKAGSSPLENLNEFSISTRHLETKTVPNTLCGNISILESKIGTITIRSEIEHEVGNSQISTEHFLNAEEILGDPDKRYYGNGYKRPVQIIKNISVDLPNQKVESLAEITNIYNETDGMEAYYRPSISVIDCMLIIAQMGQVLLYQLDNIDRRDSNTLWMREVNIDCDSPYQSCDAFTASTSVLKSKLLRVRGSQWRTSDMVGDCRGIHVRYSVAHELPTSSSVTGNVLEIVS